MKAKVRTFSDVTGWAADPLGLVLRVGRVACDGRVVRVARVWRAWAAAGARLVKTEPCRRPRPTGPAAGACLVA